MPPGRVALLSTCGVRPTSLNVNGYRTADLAGHSTFLSRISPILPANTRQRSSPPYDVGTFSTIDVAVARQPARSAMPPGSTSRPSAGSAFAAAARLTPDQTPQATCCPAPTAACARAAAAAAAPATVAWSATSNPVPAGSGSRDGHAAGADLVSAARSNPGCTRSAGCSPTSTSATTSAPTSSDTSNRTGQRPVSFRRRQD
jgi:hypothetical protein